jgi:hypothetical protein
MSLRSGVKLVATPLALFALCILGHGAPLEASGRSERYKALKVTPPPQPGTWKILERNGASMNVGPHLSSLGLGETGTGVIRSPAFTVSTETMTLTLCGQDGQRGERKKNFVAIVDAETGETLRKTYAPCSDLWQPRSWDVAPLRGRRVCFEAHDHDTAGAFAWMGIGRIDAGPKFQVDFREGLPDGWTATQLDHDARYVEVTGGVPFRSLASHESLIPAHGVVEIPCGFQAERLFFLGCTVSRARPLEVCGTVEIVYRGGPPESHPLMMGYTLDGQFKLLSESKALHLHASADSFQYYFVVRPRPRVIDRIRLRRQPNSTSIPRITAITCESAAASENLLSLPDSVPASEEVAWIESHTISTTSPDLDEIAGEVRRAHKLVLDEGPRVLRFERLKISGNTFEAASVFDVDGDVQKDIVSGGYWYRGPDFLRAHKLASIDRVGEYWDDFSDFPMDVNGDGFPDIITGAVFGGPLRWLENPQGRDALWVVHPIEQIGGIETIRFWDVDGDGVVEVCPNAGGNVIFFRLVLDENGRGVGRFTRHVVKTGDCGHGLGFGDINGDGRGDFVIPDGWLEAPADPLIGKWVWHGEFQLGVASVPILVHDVDGDGKADLIVGQGHDYGLDWYQQGDALDGKRSWTRHRVDRGSSQLHAISLDDIDNDGDLELICGKRYRAHCGKDPGATDPLFVRYFDIDGGTFTCHTIDYGPAESTSGVGIYFWVEDVDADGWKDIVAPGKEGLYLFKNLGRD